MPSRCMSFSTGPDAVPDLKISFPTAVVRTEAPPWMVGAPKPRSGGGWFGASGSVRKLIESGAAKRRIGASDLEVAAIGVGTWQWGDRRYWGYGQDYGEADLAEAFQVAVGDNLTFFDTAEIYAGGESARHLGRQIGLTGEDVVVATKFMPFPNRLTGSAVERALDASLRRLGVDRIDLYQVHWPFGLLRQRPLMRALADCVAEGKIRWIGVSNYGEKRLRKAAAILAEFGIPLVSNQIRYSLLRRAAEINGILDTCEELDITVIAYSPLAQGLLSGKYTPDSKVKGVRRYSGEFSKSRRRTVGPLLAELGAIGENHGKTRAQVALNWLIRRPGVIAIPGVKNAEQARLNAGAIGWSMTDDEALRLSLASLAWRRPSLIDRLI